MKTLIFSAAATALILTLASGLQGAWSDDDDYRGGRYTGVAPATDPLYQEECGSCHFAYPPGLLPGASWKRIMAGLEDHFGDNAELDAATENRIRGYLFAFAADGSPYRRSRAIMNSVRYMPEPPMRITETPYFRHEHREIPPKIIKLPEVGSLSRCNACHQRADQGSFREREIWIKGVGRWDD